jgi:protein required for attachment to host cells
MRGSIMKRHPSTWVLIADGARARVVAYHGPGKPLTEVSAHEYAGDHSATRDILSDTGGRTFKSASAGRSKIEPHSDPHRELKSRFAHDLADMLAQEVAAYDKLVIVAAPVTLGDLRQCLSHQVKAKVIGELAEDLTKTPNDDVANHLKDILNL